ncbi:TPA: glycosyltransferase family 4 protein [Bacillus paranthracis]|uniref:glycosyltransferase family 4 protein n=1 Tax=Bacillus cereus group sp. MYBK101-2 TaxID=3450700 RepID=UPI003300A5DA|nr:glycosyltransferase family 4 protein [Bacillus paranthracis]
MKLLFVGDLIGNTGPANVNKALKEQLPENTIFLQEQSKIKRVVDLFLQIRKVDAVLFSGMSKINIIGFRIAKLLGVKSAYLMHGCRDIEGKINGEYNQRGVDIENKVLELAPKIICVSKNFMHWMENNYPQHKKKLNYVNNGIDWDTISISKEKLVEREENTLLAVGGGMPRKKIKSVCKAIELLNQQEKKSLNLIVIGNEGKDLEEILSYPFVKYFSKVPHNEMPLYYQKAKLFVQNSSFETFGLAPIEALVNGCDLLLSKETGAKSIISTLESNDVIYDNQDVSEIARKIKSLLSNTNNQRLVNGIDKEETSVKFAANRIIEILKN